MTRVLLVTADRIGERMAGPAVRAVSLGEVLAGAGHDVTVTSTAAGSELRSEPVRCVAANGSDLDRLVAASDVVVVQGWSTWAHPGLLRTDRPVVVDLYDPVHLESLEVARHGGEREWWGRVNASVALLSRQLRRGDFFLCAGDRQRALWLGQLTAEGRLNPLTYAADPSLRSLVDAVPFGTPAGTPVRTGPGVRGVLPGLGPDDRLVLWGGGVHDWLDPLTVVHAVAQARRELPDLRLVFMGMRHPSGLAESVTARATRRLAEELGLAGSTVLFQEEWVPYERRHDVLLDADVAVTAHGDHVETEFSFRTRVLDYLWAGLPVVTTGGDAMGDLVDREGLGLVVAPGDVAGMRDALVRLLTDRELAERCRERVAEVRGGLTWQRAAEPLLRFVAEPRRAPDLVDPDRGRHRRVRRAPRRGGLAGAAQDVALVRQHLADGGLGLLRDRARSRLRRGD